MTLAYQIQAYQQIRPEFSEAEINEIRNKLSIPKYIKKNRKDILDIMVFAKVFSYAYLDLLYSTNNLSEETRNNLNQYLKHYNELKDIYFDIIEFENNQYLKHEKFGNIMTTIKQNNIKMADLLTFYINNFLKESHISEEDEDSDVEEEETIEED